MSARSRLAGLSILVVDDDRDNREVLETYLAYVGATVIAATTAEEALEQFKAARPTTVLTDIAMPGRDGLWLLQQIRAIAAGSRVTVVAVTGHALPHARENIRAAGFDGLIVKPLDLDHVVDTIAALTGR